MRIYDLLMAAEILVELQTEIEEESVVSQAQPSEKQDLDVVGWNLSAQYH